MFRTRPRQTKKRTLSFAALGLAPALLLGGLVGTDVLRGSDADPGDVVLTAAGPVTLIGHGHGHGRGMGQWGALGYAKQGWSADRILRHYYGGTTAGKVSNPDISVRLAEKSAVNVHADAGMRVGNKTVAPGQAVSLSGNTATITAGCGGPVVDTVTATFVGPINGDPNRPANEWLKFCGSGEPYRGALGYEDGRVVNRLHVDDYVKGVLPREISPGWVDDGGMEAVKAQAVAARTYALSAIAGGKKIDNTQGSQVYSGAGVEDPRTNAAADATAGQIRLANGQPAFTEFSASTGGYTAGVQFPAVIDEGDAISPNHNWTSTISPGSIASAFGVGALQSFEVIEANGLGPEDGRALKVRVVGSGGTVEATGEQVRQKLGLKSDYFSVQGQQTRPKIIKPEVGPAGPGGFDLGSLDLSTLGLDSLTPLLEQVVPGAGEFAPMMQQLLATGGGAITERFDELGGIGGILGEQLSEPRLTAGGNGVMAVFSNGVILFSELTGAHALVGPAFAEFFNSGGPAVHGFPEADDLG